MLDIRRRVRERRDPVRSLARTPGLMVGAVVLVLAIAGCSDGTSGGTITTTSSSSTPAEITTTTSRTPTTTTVAPSEVATRFVEAIGAQSPGQLLDLVEVGAAVDVAGAKDYADLDNWLAWNQALGWQQTEVGCNADGLSIVCHYTYRNPWMEQEGIPSNDGGRYTLEIASGKITSITELTDVDAFWDLWLEFGSWVSEKHPDARIIDGVDPILTDEALELWWELVPEFTERLLLLDRGNAYLDALLSLDPAELDRVAGGDRNLYEDKYLQVFTDVLNYETASRSCDVTAGRLVCTLEGTDDLADVLGLTYFDEFAIRVSGGRIVDIKWSTATVPDGALDDFQDWLRENQPDLFASDGDCFGLFKEEGLPTARACVQAWLDAAAAYVADTAGG